MRGVDARCFCPFMYAVGSSPHAWGRSFRWRLQSRTRRFIPTCVGSIKSNEGIRKRDARFIPTCVGSMWMLGPRVHQLRFIPTCVGSINWCLFRSQVVAVHPHMRGVDTLKDIIHCKKGRFIPTCVGSILFCIFQPFLRPVHPHMRGVDIIVWPEHQCRIRFIPTCVGSMNLIHAPASVLNGSSPHAWGRYNSALRYT